MRSNAIACSTSCRCRRRNPIPLILNRLEVYMRRNRRRAGRPDLWMIRLLSLIVPRRLRVEWKEEWEAELENRSARRDEWRQLDAGEKRELLRRSIGAFWDALVLQPRRLEDEMMQD